MLRAQDEPVLRLLELERELLAEEADVPVSALVLLEARRLARLQQTLCDLQLVPQNRLHRLGIATSLSRVTKL